MICVQNLVKRYGATVALDGISFSVERGEVVGLLGPNGAGKSTAMNILTGCLSAGSGTVTVDGIDIREDPLAVKRKIGYLPEQPPVYGEMTVWEYLSFVHELKGSRFDKAPHLREIMALVKLTDVKDRLVGNLSKGYRQRVGIAQALIGDPDLVILDEPTVGLDPKQIIEVRSLIRTLAQRHTVVLSTHILSEVQAVCSRVIIMDRGRVVADEAIDSLSRLVEDSVAYRATVVGTPKDVERMLAAVDGIRTVTPTGERDADGWVYLLEGKSGADFRKSLFYAAAKEGKPLLSLAPVGGDLESVFLRLTEEKLSQRKGEKA